MPSPKWVHGIVCIAEIAYVTCEDEYVPGHFKRVRFEVSPVVGKLQMEVGRILYFMVLRQ